MARCDELAGLTEEPGRVTRRFLCDPMRAVHQRMSDWMRAAGMSPRVDDVGNVIGRRQGAEASRILLMGSHLDSVPGGGRYDGVLGVMVALAVAEALGDDALPFHLDVIGFSEEEGIRYSKPLLGSAATAGVFRDEWLDRTDGDGVVMRDAIRAFGLDPSRIREAAYDPSEVLGYVEAHLEQGPILEAAGAPVGVVSGIVGQSRLLIEFSGVAGHAGTTPMETRQDALVSACRFVRAVRHVGRREEELRATVGQMQVHPNAPNVIPDRVRLSLDIRHPRDVAREQAIKDLMAEGRRIAESDGTRFEVLENSPQGAVAVDPTLSDRLFDAAVATGASTLRLPSGAGHDAIAMAERFPVAMLFLRHPGGVSHHPDERVDVHDVAIAIDILTRFVRSAAEKEASQR